MYTENNKDDERLQGEAYDLDPAVRAEEQLCERRIYVTLFSVSKQSRKFDLTCNEKLHDLATKIDHLLQLYLSGQFI